MSRGSSRYASELINWTHETSLWRYLTRLIEQHALLNSSMIIICILQKVITLLIRQGGLSSRLPWSLLLGRIGISYRVGSSLSQSHHLGLWVACETHHGRGDEGLSVALALWLWVLVHGKILIIKEVIYNLMAVLLLLLLVYELNLLILLALRRRGNAQAWHCRPFGLFVLDLLLLLFLGAHDIVCIDQGLLVGTFLLSMILKILKLKLLLIQTLIQWRCQLIILAHCWNRRLGRASHVETAQYTILWLGDLLRDLGEIHAVSFIISLVHLILSYDISICILSGLCLLLLSQDLLVVHVQWFVNKLVLRLMSPWLLCAMLLL